MTALLVWSNILYIPIPFFWLDFLMVQHHPILWTQRWVHEKYAIRFFYSMYRLLTPPGTKGSSIDYFKRKISPSQSQLLCRWDGKRGTHEVRGHRFGSWLPHARVFHMKKSRDLLLVGSLPGFNIFFWLKLLWYRVEPSHPVLKRDFGTGCFTGDEDRDF